jgi:hypothetical protein
MKEENMKITTETGSKYLINDGFCTKIDINGKHVDSFKIWSMKPVPNVDVTLLEVLEMPEGEPKIGERLYVSGKETWWVSTKIVSVEPDGSKEQ